MLEPLRDLALRWYSFTSTLSAGVTPAVQDLDARIGLPLVTALLLGILGAAAPCQLTQTVGMLTILGRRGDARARWRGVLAYLAGKTLVYTGLGLFAVLLGVGLAEVAIPVFVAARKALGPLMIVVGLAMVGVVRWSWLPGAGVAARVRAAARRRADGAPFLLGVAFGFSFCPTLFALFVGLLIPLALTRPDGVLYPALFALGTALPLLTVLGLMSLGGGAAQRYARSIGAGGQVAGLVAGALLIVVGLNDTVVYWLL